MKILVNVGFFLAGGLIGSYLTLTLLRNKMKEEYEQIVQEELASIRAYKERTKKAENPEEADGGEKAKIKENLQAIREVQERERKEYNKISETYKPKPPSAYPELDEVGNRPYVIDTMQFSEEMPGFDKITIYYYAGDNTLLDDAEDVMEPDEVVKTVGVDAFDSFGQGSVNPDIVYVRNECLAIDYEIIRLNERYSDMG